MVPWIFIDKAEIPGSGDEIRLYQRGNEFSIRVGGYELMNSRVHGSEEALAELACGELSHKPALRVLVGGLGMGFTLAAALKYIGPESNVVVSELVPSVVLWNRQHLGELTEYPLKDKRVTVREGDVATIIKDKHTFFDAIMLDVDNGPEGLSRKENDWIYSLQGLRAIFKSLYPKGILAVWSSNSNKEFFKRMKKAGFDVSEVRVRSRGSHGGERHIIWIAKKK